MRNLLIILIAFVTISSSNAQHTILESFYENYKDIEDVTSFNIGGNFLKNMVIDDDNGHEIRSRLNQLYILNMPYSLVSPNELGSLKKDIRQEHYEELITFREGKERIHVYIKENKDHIEELLVMIEDPSEELLLVSLSGQILLEDLDHINIDGRAGEVLREMKY